MPQHSEGTPRITALILTYNGARLLDKCIESLSFCDDILVVDSNSTDATCDIAERLGAHVVKRPWNGPADQFAFAFDLIDREYPNEWIISLDQDEVCTNALRESVINAVRQSGDDLAGHMVNRTSWYYDRFMKHSGWSPDHLFRLCRRGRVRVEVSGAHYSFVPEGKTTLIDGDIVHYPYTGFDNQVDKNNSYAEQGACDLRRRGAKGGLAAAIGHGLWRFLRMYVLRLGFLDGRAGFIVAVHDGFYAFSKYLRVEKASWGEPFNYQ